MGWFYPSSVCSRRELLDLIFSECDCPSRRYCCGNVCWILRQPVDSESWIECHLMRRVDGRWGYKSLAEADGPFYYSCPPVFLDSAPVVDPEWREGVRLYWKRRAAKRAERAALRRSWGDLPKRVPRGWSSV
jgi:hypothetical protein